MKKTTSLLSLLGGLFAVSTAQAAYQLLDLSTYLDASSNYAYSSSLNISDGAAGQDGGFNAAFWTGSDLQNLGTLGGSASAAFGVNNNNQVVGYSFLSTPNTWHATLWNNSTTATDLGTLGGNNSEAFAINNAGNVVGWSHDSNGDSRATLWSGSSIIDLGAVDSSIESEAYAINASNQIVGLSMIGSTRYATSWSYDGSNVTVTNLGVGEAYAINDGGTIVGASGDSAVIWSGGNMTSLTSLFGESSASDINNAGLIVGDSRDASGDYHGVLWSGGNIFNLTTLLEQPLIDAGWLITDAFSINDKGNILAYAEDSTGVSRTVLLFTASATAVPEANTAIMLMLGLCLFGILRTKWIITA